MWKAINGTNGMIEVSDKGQVRSLLSGTPRVLKTQADSKGYQRLRVTINRVKMSFKVHREVAKAFLPNPNNCVSNLEWISNIDNVHHAIRIGLWKNVIATSKQTNEKRKIPIIGHYISGNLAMSKYFESISQAEREIESRHIVDVLKGRRKHVKGWTFSYAEGVMPSGN